jgi:hypothetical protein
MEAEHRIHAVAFQHGEWWIAQCLEYDIATQARTLDDLLVEVDRILVGHLIVGKIEGREPFSNIPKAPKRFWEMYQRARTRLSPVEPESLPFPEERHPILELRAAA